MMEYVNFEHSTHLLVCVSFVLTASVFFGAMLVALRMKRGDREHLAALPLEDSKKDG